MAFSFLDLAVRALVGALVRSRRGLHRARHSAVGAAPRAGDPASAGGAAEARDAWSGPVGSGSLRSAAFVAACASGDAPDASALASSARSPHVACRVRKSIFHAARPLGSVVPARARGADGSSPSEGSAKAP